MKAKIIFDMEATILALREGKDLSGMDDFLTPLIKQLTETAMQVELGSHVADEQGHNRKNGSSSNTMRSPAGEFQLNTSRHPPLRLHEPQIVNKVRHR